MSQQCFGITRNGERCKITRNLTDGYCRLHKKQQQPQHNDDRPETSFVPQQEPESPSKPQQAPFYSIPPADPHDEGSSNSKMIVLALGVLFFTILMLVKVGKGQVTGNRLS